MKATSTLDPAGTGKCVFTHPACEAELHLHGAHITRWQPTGAKPVIFTSPRAIFAPGTAIRGGVPICLPWFGPLATDLPAPAHGLVRTRMWQLVEETFDDAGWRVHLRFNQPEPAGPYWPHPFSADFRVGFGRELSMELQITNTGTAAFTFGEALHAYYAVSDVRQVSVEGLQNTEYLDKPSGNQRLREEGPAIHFTQETDRVYVNTSATCTIHDPGWRRRIVVEKQHSRSTVVWNPFETRASQMSDLGSEHWTGFVCVETANAVDNVLPLAPGERHAMSVRVRVEEGQA